MVMWRNEGKKVKNKGKCDKQQNIPIHQLNYKV